MRRLAFPIILLLAGLPTLAQVPMTGAGKGTPAVAAFQGAGDIVGSALVYYSCSRVYTAALALTSTNMCDLKDAATGTVSIGTIRGSSTGFADQSAYFVGALTPSAACLAAAGGACRVSKMYNQVTPGTLDVSQATLANMPGILFSSSPTGTLPVLDCSVGTALLVTGSNPTITQPWTVSSVVKGALGASSTGFIGSAAGIVNFMGSGGSTNTIGINAGSTVTAAMTTLTWASAAGIFNGASSVITVNTTDTTGLNAGTTAFGANALRVCRQGSGGASWNGQVAEVALWSNLAFTTGGGGQTQLMEANQHSSSGYSF